MIFKLINFIKHILYINIILLKNLYIIIQLTTDNKLYKNNKRTKT